MPVTPSVELNIGEIMLVTPSVELNIGEIVLVTPSVGLNFANVQSNITEIISYLNRK
jgi:hypothetical protein